MSGLVPLSHTWLLSGDLLEADWMPLYLLIVFLSGSAAWWLAERGRTSDAVLVVAAGWTLTLAARLGISAAEPRYPVAADVCAGLVFLGWTALLGVGFFRASRGGGELAGAAGEQLGESDRDRERMAKR